MYRVNNVQSESPLKSQKSQDESKRSTSLGIIILTNLLLLLLLLTKRRNDAALTVVATLTSHRTLETNIPIDGLHSLKVSPSGCISSKQDIHLLKRESLSLRYIEPDECGAHEAEKAEDDVRAVSDARKHIGRDLTDDEVVHPVGGCAQGNAVGAVGHGPDFCDENPGAWSPGVAEVNNEEPDHGH